MCSSFGPGMSGFQVINRGGGGCGGSKASPRSQEAKKKKKKNPVRIVLSGCPLNGV